MPLQNLVQPTEYLDWWDCDFSFFRFVKNETGSAYTKVAFASEEVQLHDAIPLDEKELVWTLHDNFSAEDAKLKRNTRGAQRGSLAFPSQAAAVSP